MGVEVWSWLFLVVCGLFNEWFIVLSYNYCYYDEFDYWLDVGCFIKIVKFFV